MRPGVRQNVLWAVPAMVLVAVLLVRAFGPPEWLSLIQEPFHTFLASLASGTLARATYAERGEELYLFLTGFAMLFAFSRGRMLWAAIICVLAVAVAGAFAWRMATAQGLYFDAAFPAASLVATLITGAFTWLVAGAGERTLLKESLGNQIAPATMAALNRQPQLLKLAGEARTMTYLVCGIRRYAQLADAFADEPEAFRKLTRRTLNAMAEMVMKYRGTVDRINPGGLSAFFNAPLEDPEHAVHACECALAITRAMESVNHALEQERRDDGTPYPPIEVGIGLHSGAGVVGDFGTDGRPEYTVAGHAVVLADEIETYSGKYGPAIIASEAARDLAEKNFAFLEVDTVVARSGTAPVKLYALLGNPLLRASPKFRALATFHDHIFQEYRAGQWGKARALIEQCRQLSGASPQLYDLYLARIAYYESHPPGENWNGAVRSPVV